MDRNDTILAIRKALRARSGRAWSVTGGSGTAWGWITVDAPPARRTSRSQPREGTSGSSPEDYRDEAGARLPRVDTGRPGGQMTEADAALLGELLGVTVYGDGVSIPSSSDYYREYVERAEGRSVTKIATPYWD